MNNNFYKSTAFFIIATLMLVLGGVAYVNPTIAQPLVRKIVVFDTEIVNESAREALVNKFGGVTVKDLDLIGGKAVLLPPQAIIALERNGGGFEG